MIVRLMDLPNERTCSIGFRCVAQKNNEKNLHGSVLLISICLSGYDFCLQQRSF